MASAIADASVLIHLSKAKRLGLLQALYDLIIVPEAVWREVVEEGGDRPGSKEVRKAREAGWVEAASIDDHQMIPLLRQRLGPGESEAIALAIQRPGVELLVDEQDARRVARAYDVPVTGTVGILIRAAARGEATNIKQVLTDMREEGGFWIGDGGVCS